MIPLLGALRSGEQLGPHPFGDGQASAFGSRADQIVLVGCESQLSDDGAGVVTGGPSGSGHRLTLAHTRNVRLGVASYDFGAYDKSMSNEAPRIGTKVRAITTTATAQTVVIEVTKVDEEQAGGWLVYGYRKHRGVAPRQTAYPRLYFVPRDPA